MTVTYSPTTTKLNRLKVALGSAAITPASGYSVDAAGSAGFLVIGTSSLAAPSTGVLATFTLQYPSFSYAGNTATLLGTTLTATASATGTAASAAFWDKNSAAIITGLTVGTSGSDINLNSTSISSTQSVSITSGTITHP
jgi:hypothetical protein